MKKQTTEFSRKAAAFPSSKGARLSAILIASIYGSCVEPSYTRLSVTRDVPDAAMATSVGAGEQAAPRGEAGGSLGKVDDTSAQGSEPSLYPAASGGASALPGAAGTAAPVANAGSRGDLGGDAGPGGSGGSGSGGTWLGGAGGTLSLVGGTTFTGRGGGAPGAETGGANGGDSKQGGGATGTGGSATGGSGTGGSGPGGSGPGGSGAGGSGISWSGDGGATVVDRAHYNFETSSQGWRVAVGTEPFISIESSAARHYAGRASLAGQVSAVAGKNYFLEVEPPVPAIPANATITFHVFVPAVARLSAIRSYVLNDAFVLVYVDTPTTALERDGWTTITLPVPAKETNIIRLGVKFMSSGTWVGIVYLDSIEW